MCCAAVGSNKSQQKGTSFLPSLHLTFFFFQKSKNNLLLGSIKIKTQSSLHPTLLHIAFVNWFNYSRRRKLLQKVMEAEIKWKEQKRKKEKINKLEQMFKWRLRIGRYWFIWYVPLAIWYWSPSTFGSSTRRFINWFKSSNYACHYTLPSASQKTKRHSTQWTSPRETPPFVECEHQFTWWVWMSGRKSWCFFLAEDPVLPLPLVE